MSVLDRIKYFQEVWTNVLPHIPAPAPEDVARWCNYPDTAVEQAILRTAKKFSSSRIPVQFDVTTAYRYVTGTARLIAGQGVQQ